MLAFALGLLLQVRAGAPPVPRQAPAVGASEKSPVHVQVLPDTVLVGQPFTLVLRLRTPTNTIVDFPSAPDSGSIVDSLGPMVRRDSIIGDSLETTVTYPLAAWNIGTQPILLGNINMETPGGRITLSLDSIKVFVRSVLPKDTTKYVPRPPRSIVSMPFDFWATLKKWWPLLVLGILALVGAILGRKYWLRRQLAKRIDRDWAESQFEQIEAMHLIEQGSPERYAILMAEVVRGYLTRQFRSIHRSATTTQLANVLRHESAIPANRVQSLFARLDLLKFAAVSLDASEARDIGDESRAVVHTIEDTLRQEREAARAAAEAQRHNPKSRTPAT
jgi:hypothetical protein